jgi:RNA:NAD 2'-phosphotransferase (TPT1/KptA family)
MPKPTSIPSRLYHVTSVDNVPAILKAGIEPSAGERHIGSLRHAWKKPKVFLAINLMAAYEIAMVFEHERIRGWDFVILFIDPLQIPQAKFVKDGQYDYGVWTTFHIPPSAIVDVHEPDLESEEFARFMGHDTDSE